MHELSLAAALLEQVTQVAAQQHAARVTSVHVVCGARLAIVPEFLQTAFEAVAEGTVAEGAGLQIDEEPLAARCRPCGTQFAPALDDYRCPACGQADVDLIAGCDLTLRTMVLEAAEPVVS